MDAITDLHFIARVLRGDVCRDYVVAPGPNHSARDRSMKVMLSATAKDGFIVHSYSGDDWRECRDYVRQMLYGHEPVKVAFRDPRPLLRASSAADNSGRALQLWAEASDPRDTLVEQYLAQRGLALPDELATHVVRYHPALWFNGEHLPGMLTLFRDIITNEPKAIQRTFLTADGKKIERRTLGPSSHAAIKLNTDPRGATQFYVGEGFESALAAYLSGLRPAWAMGSAQSLSRMPVLNGVPSITVLGETDEANAAAIHSLGKAWCDAGRKVQVLMPHRGDVADAYSENA